MWKCPKCQTENSGNFCTKCGTKKIQQTSSSVTSLQIEQLAKSVKTMKIICIILAVAVIALSVLFLFVYNGVWDNIVTLWENAELLWESDADIRDEGLTNVSWLQEGFHSLQSQIEDLWDEMWYYSY